MDIYTSKYRNGSGYLAKLQKAESQGNAVFGATLLVGVTMTALVFGTNFILYGVSELKKTWSYAAASYIHASTARYVTYKVAELSAIEEVKKEQDSNMIQGKITLDDVIVPEQVRKELKMICVHIPEKKKAALQMLGCKIATGYILYAPPGNGKTLIAHAIACEANAKFISVSGSECMQKYAGHNTHYIKDLFKKARENAPCIVFIDEIDTVCTKHSNNNVYSDEERNRIVNQFLHELDGFNRIKGVTVIAATNRLESLDETLIRPGRLSKHIQIPLPDKSLREKILGLYMEKVLTSSDVNLAKLADETNGFSGADLENLVNEAKFHVVDRILKKSQKMKS